MCRNGKYFEVEMIKVDEDNNVVDSDNPDEYYDNYEEALKVAKEASYRDPTREFYDYVVVNEVEFVDDDPQGATEKASFRICNVLNDEQADYINEIDGVFGNKVIELIENAFKSYIDIDVVKKYVGMGFNYDQLEQIFEGLENDLSVDEVNTYAKPELNEDEMQEMREELERKLREKRGY